MNSSRVPVKFRRSGIFKLVPGVVLRLRNSVAGDGESGGDLTGVCHRGSI